MSEQESTIGDEHATGGSLGDPVRDRVLRQLVRELVDQAGAGWGAYLSIRDHASDPRVVTSTAPVAGGDRGTGGLPSSVLEHVRKTRRMVVLEDATQPNPFSNDAHLARRRPRSVVCLPVMHRGDLVGLVYLENELMPRSLTGARIEALERLAAQAGQLVETADVYADLMERDGELAAMRMALRSSCELLQAVLDNMVDAVLICDATGRITMINESADRLFLLDREEALLLSVEELGFRLGARQPDGRPFSFDELPIVRALRGEIVSSVDMTLTDPRTEGDVQLRVNAAPMQDENGAIVGAVAAVSNVTEIVELDRLRDEFLRIAAHELKTPVAIVLGYADALGRAASEAPPQQRQMLEGLARGADRIDRITADLLLLVQLRAGRVDLVLEERLDLAKVADAVARRLEPETTARRIDISAPDPVVVHGDRQLLEQVLSNLMANALRYSPAAARIDVKLTTHQDTEAVVSVTDHGVGIARERQPRIFEPFYRAHTDTPHDVGGIGIGLYLAKVIVRRHGGRIGFVSEEGKGSTFTFRLPLAEG